MKSEKDMEKKAYIKPSMKTYKMKSRTAILVGSGEKGRRSDDWLGSIPALDENCLA